MHFIFFSSIVYFFFIWSTTNIHLWSHTYICLLSLPVCHFEFFALLTIDFIILPKHYQLKHYMPFYFWAFIINGSMHFFFSFHVSLLLILSIFVYLHDDLFAWWPICWMCAIQCLFYIKGWNIVRIFIQACTSTSYQIENQSLTTTLKLIDMKTRFTIDFDTNCYSINWLPQWRLWIIRKNDFEWV